MFTICYKSKQILNENVIYEIASNKYSFSMEKTARPEKNPNFIKKSTLNIVRAAKWKCV